MVFKCFFRRLIRDQKGTVTACVAILIPAILLISALGLDFGRAFVLKHKLQAICDATSLAGASAVHGEFFHDEDGNITGQILVVSVPLCDQYAQDTLAQNIAVAGLDKEGVTIESFSGLPLDKNNDGYLDSYHVEMTAKIKTVLIGPLVGMESLTVPSKAESMVKQKNPLP